MLVLLCAVRVRFEDLGVDETLVPIGICIGENLPKKNEGNPRESISDPELNTH
jgi:hypothetical protein